MTTPEASNVVETFRQDDYFYNRQVAALAETRHLRPAAYVLRRRQSWELLVFEQAARAGAGRQIPAGGVQFNESLEEAVLREVREETGLTGLRSG